MHVNPPGTRLWCRQCGGRMHDRTERFCSGACRQEWRQARGQWATAQPNGAATVNAGFEARTSENHAGCWSVSGQAVSGVETYGEVRNGVGTGK